MSVSSPPPMSRFAAGMYDWLEPIAPGEAENGYPVGVLCGGIGEMFRDVEDLVRARPGREPWQQAFDVDQAPDWHLDWLGQLVGVRDMQGLTADQKRAKIKAEAGFYRGSIPSLVSAVRNTLTPVNPGTPARVIVQERNANAWELTVITDPSETPDVTATTTAVQQATAAGIVPTVVQRSSPTVDDMTRTVDAITVSVDTATFGDVT